MKTLLIFALAMGLTGVSALAATVDSSPPAALANAEIPFANHGGVYDWHADGEGAILIESRTHQYFRASFISPCFGLPFAQSVGFVTDPRDVLDKFQSIVVGHHQCYFKDFTAVPKPPGFAS